MYDLIWLDLGTTKKDQLKTADCWKFENMTTIGITCECRVEYYHVLLVNQIDNALNIKSNRDKCGDKVTFEINDTLQYHIVVFLENETSHGIIDTRPYYSTTYTYMYSSMDITTSATNKQCEFTLIVISFRYFNGMLRP